MSGYSAPRPITIADDVTNFDSGEPHLDRYLRSRALTNHIEGASRCFVTAHDGRVVGYYGLFALDGGLVLSDIVSCR